MMTYHSDLQVVRMIRRKKKPIYNSEMKLIRPLIFFDLETTGTSVVSDRIVQIATLKIFPNGEIERKKMLLNPTVNIPVDATKIHGIDNEMVENEPKFSQIAKALNEYFHGCDIAGYNSDDFDIPLLILEFQRCGIEFPDWDLNFVDVMKLERRLNSHKLSDTYKRYTGKELEDAHDAGSDTEATFKVLQEQIKYNFEDSIDPAALDIFIQGDKTRFDYAGKAYVLEGEVFWNMGKNRDKPVLEDRDYLNWVLNSQQFPGETKRKLKIVLEESKKKQSYE